MKNRISRMATLGMWMVSTIFAGATDHFVSLQGAHNSPFTSWADAATNIQAAIDASAAGDTVWVTNGVYQTGGKSMDGILTNRVALNKPVTVVSVNGPAATIIQGNWDANTNGPLAVRCAWVTNGAVLNGFTLQGGATRTNGDATLLNGGGVWGVSTQAVVVNCWIYTNAAAGDGGGSFQATLNRCKVVGNHSFGNGGGSAFGLFKSALFLQNFASGNGGGVYGGEVFNCTIGNNNATSGGGMYPVSSPPKNSILVGNNFTSPSQSTANYAHQPSLGSPAYCCIATPFGLPHSGIGNIAANPQFVDDVHLAVTSPCRGAGSALYASDYDMDGESWLNPPSIGCDEVIEANINGSLSVSAQTQWGEVVERQMAFLVGGVTGRATRVEWYFGDGSVLTNISALTPIHVWTNAGDYTVTFTAYNQDFTNGVSTNFSVHVVPVIAPTFLSMGLITTNFTLNFLGQSNVNGVVEYTTNLTEPVTWQTVGSIFSYSNVIQVIDRKATNEARFYRVRIP